MMSNPVSLVEIMTKTQVVLWTSFRAICVIFSIKFFLMASHKKKEIKNIIINTSYCVISYYILNIT